MRASVALGAGALVAALAITALELTAPQADAVATLQALQSEMLKETCVAAPSQVCDAVDLDAGTLGPARYRRVEIAAQSCTQEKVYSDGGTQLLSTQLRPTPPRAGIEVLHGTCVLASSIVGTRSPDAGVSYLGLGCACRKSSGTCQYRNDAGTLVTAPLKKTLGPGYPPFEVWSGTGCQTKSCTELAGETSWPSVCPR